MRRRELVAAVGAAAVLAVPARARAQDARDGGLVDHALRLEHTTVLAYDTVVAAGLLRPTEAALARRLRAHEAEHAAAAARTLGELGRPPREPPARVQDVELPQVRAALEGLEDRGAALALLEGLERLSIDFYTGAIGRLRDARYVQLAATILAAEASHLVAWRAIR